MPANDDELRDHINKRLTLNLLIQGAATHAFLSAHYLVRDQLDALNPKLIPLYDKVTVGGFLSGWCGDLVLILGSPKRFWRRVENGGHLFSGHPLLARHGGALAEASKLHAIARAREKGMSTLPGVHYAQLLGVVIRLAMNERRHTRPLVDLAKQATHEIWGIDQHLLRAALSYETEVGEVRKPETFAGRMFRSAAAGWGGVERRGGRMVVVARAWFWPFLAHELVKGTAELVCLHGLNTLDAQTYDAVIDVTDKIEYEQWTMQAGSELWRRLLKINPPNRTLAETLMRIARLPPLPLEALMLALVEEPEAAADWLGAL